MVGEAFGLGLFALRSEVSVLVHKQEGFPIAKAQENQLLPKRGVSPALSFSALADGQARDRLMTPPQVAPRQLSSPKGLNGERN